MYKVIDKLKLNKFMPVKVPSQRDLFNRLGERLPSSNVDGATAVFNMSKNEQGAVIEGIGNRMSQEEYDEYARAQAEAVKQAEAVNQAEAVDKSVSSDNENQA